MNIIDKVDSCIERSTAVLEKVCPHNNVSLGIKVRDSYHKENSPMFSMFTATEMLWAITSSNIYPKTYYIVAELLNIINAELGNDYFNKQNRLFSWSFLLLSMTSAGQPIFNSMYIETLEKILHARKDNGAWGTYTDGDENIRATSLCLIALCECYNYVGKTEKEPFSRLENVIVNSCKWLSSKYIDNKYCNRKIISLEEIKESEKYTYGVELTAWATYALILCVKYLGVAKIGIAKIENNIKMANIWLSQLDFNSVASSPEIELEIYKKNNNLTKHKYGSGSLDILILTMIEYRMFDGYRYIKNFDECINKAMIRFLNNENDGKWYDKNSDSYDKIWAVSYAIKVLNTYKKYIYVKQRFKIELIKNIRLSISLITTKLHKYIFNLPLIIIYFIISICIFYFHEFIKNRIDFINSTAIGLVGLLLGAIGILVSIYKREKK